VDSFDANQPTNSNIGERFGAVLLGKRIGYWTFNSWIKVEGCLNISELFTNSMRAWPHLSTFILAANEMKKRV
jgi:hypothetical protein